MAGHGACGPPTHSGSGRQPDGRGMATATRHQAATATAGGDTRPAKPSLRVLFCTDNLGVGGTELNAVRTAERLAPLGVELQVALLGDDGPLRARYAALGIPVRPFPIASLYGASAIRQGRAFAAHCRSGRVDVIHCHDAYSNVFGSIWGRAAGVPGIIVSRRWGAMHNSGKLRLANRLAYRLASRVLANSAGVGTSLAKDEGVPPRRVVVVPNFVEPDAFEPPAPESRAAARADLGIPAGARVIGVVARLDPVKDHATLLGAFARLAPALPDVHLAIVGDGPCRGDLEALATKLGLGGRVLFAGMRPHRPNLHHLFDVSALSSLSEGFPNSVVEAMAAARPVVATDVGGVRDALVDGVTGLLVPAGDPAALGAALERVLGDPATAAAMGRAGRERAESLFAAEPVVAGLVSLYGELARR